jgi:predicted transcriptional regulator
MARDKESELRNHALPVAEEDDKTTLASIDEGIGDAKRGRTVPIEEVGKLLPQWITASFSRKAR